jgi:hypothetical protein
MKGTIRIILGMVILFGVAGGLDNATDAQLLPLVLLGAFGAFTMYSGTNAMKNTV